MFLNGYLFDIDLLVSHGVYAHAKLSNKKTLQHVLSNCRAIVFVVGMVCVALVIPHFRMENVI